MEAELLNDLESLIGLTERDWNKGKHPGRMSRQLRRRYNYAYRVRHRYMIYFKFNLPSCIGSYHRLPASHRDVFLQQIRADFFGRRGIEHVDWKHFPAPFQRLTSGSSRVSASNEE